MRRNGDYLGSVSPRNSGIASVSTRGCTEINVNIYETPNLLVAGMRLLVIRQTPFRFISTTLLHIHILMPALSKIGETNTKYRQVLDSDRKQRFWGQLKKKSKIYFVVPSNCYDKFRAAATQFILFACSSFNQAVYSSHYYKKPNDCVISKY